MPIAYLALGSNLGDRIGQMREALSLLEADASLSVFACSSVYQNRAIGMGEADDFLNAVVAVQTELLPLELLDACLSVENELGRVRTDEWAPRTIDLDVLAYEDVVMNGERLHLPHPRIAERDFVAVPLSEVAPSLVVFDKPIKEIVADLPSVDLEFWAEKLR
ncbi:MAG TPA: 2-amino-4-hydroxy-6-hydroxymethyldihydropteridine diphosphokinase [Opitutae bacterium]|nr:2-amino-4-hydroxy-6-hydroxymethyldihydropteridine diphosphokinase [Opitutae bacterium]